MTGKFNQLNSDEYTQLKDAIVWITVLVAGADDNIDQEEKEWAEKLTKIRSFANDDSLHEFYQEVGEQFSEKLEKEIASLPKSVEERNSILQNRLAGLNTILAKLPSKDGASFYQTYTSFAEHVAKASGGFLRFFSVSGAEKKVMGLDILDEITYEEE